MDKKVNKQLLTITTSHLKHILDIANCKDSNFNKVKAINIYCNKSLEAVNKVFDEYFGEIE